VHRALAAIGKPATADNSFDAICNEIDKDLRHANLGGECLRLDCLNQIHPLMLGVWACGESKCKWALSSGSTYPEELFDASASEVLAYRGFIKGLPAVRALATKYTHTLGIMVAVAGGSSSGSGGAGTSSGGDGKGPGKRGTGAGDAGGSGGGGAGGTPSRADVVGARLSNVGDDGKGFSAHTKYGKHWFNVAECEKFIKANFKVTDVCVPASLAPHVMNVSGLSELQLALEYCACNHTVNAPQHKLALRREVFNQLTQAPGCYERRRNLRKAAEVAGDAQPSRYRRANAPGSFRRQAVGK
jgi:hypothetical protein